MIATIGKAPSAVAMLGSMAAVGFSLAGCMNSPTYGTDKTASAQLVGDMTGILSLTPPDKKRIDYKPRAALVVPAKGEAATLPEPQQSLAENNPQWPVSPEEKRAALRAEADANAKNPFYQPDIDADVGRSLARNKPMTHFSPRYEEANVNPAAIGSSSQRAEVQRRLRENRQGTATSRQYLSEPPLDYRAPAATAPADDLGEDEYKKERRLKAASAKTKSWSDYLPW